MDEQMSKFLNKVYILAIVLVAVLALSLLSTMGFQRETLDHQNQDQITVSGTGKVYAKPDVAIINLGVTTTGTTVADVINKNSEKMNAVIEAVKKLGVEEKDIQTTNYNLYPQYNYTEARGRLFEGYTLDQNVQVKIRDFTKTGSILAKATDMGSNLVGNLQFTIDDADQFKQEARAKAIEKAKANAKNLAEKSGISLGKIVNVYENSNSYAPMMYDSKMVSGMGGAETSVTPTIAAGQQEIEITINLTYLVK